MDINTLRSLLQRAASVAASDHGDLPSGLERFRATRPEVAAAVLVPVVARPTGPTVLLTVRAQALADHAGQVSFPGGRIEPFDDGAVGAALRESWEEVGLASTAVEVIGPLTPYTTITNFRVTPVLGLVLPEFELRPDPVEVEAVFEVPLTTFRDPLRRERRRRAFGGIEVAYWAYPCDGHLVWGATAAVLVDLCRRLDAA